MHGFGHGRSGDKTTSRKSPHGKILGTTTVGERGQVVIPADARAAMGIGSGDKLVVFGNSHNGSITLVKAEIFDRYAEFFMSKSKKLEKFAEEILRATQDGGIEDDEEEDESAVEAMPDTHQENAPESEEDPTRDFIDAKRKKINSDDA